jgi:hypothetical protein
MRRRPPESYGAELQKKLRQAPQLTAIFFDFGLVGHSGPLPKRFLL